MSNQSNDTPTRVDRYLRWGLVVTLLAVAGLLVYGTQTVNRNKPPIPQRVVSPTGALIYGKSEILDGKKVFQRTDLMDFGSLYGNGAYLGPDWGDDYLYRETGLLRDFTARRLGGVSYAALPTAERAVVDAQVASGLSVNGWHGALIGVWRLGRLPTAASGRSSGWLR